MFKYNYMKDKNFILLFLGSLVSGIGSRIYGFGIAIYLIDLTGKAFSMSVYIAIWTFVLFAIAPIAATFTDRWKQKVRVIYMTDYGRGIVYTITGITVYYFNSVGNTDMVLFMVYAMLTLIALQTAFFGPAMSAIIPQIVHKDELVSASSMFQLTRSIQNVLGLSIGALLYLQFGIVILIFINAISFFVSGFSEMFIRYEKAQNHDRLLETAYQEEEVVTEGKLKHYAKRVYSDLKEAVKYIVHDAKPIMAVIYIIVISVTVIEPWFSVGVTYLIKEYLSFNNVQPEYILSSIKTAEAIGLIVMSLLVAVIASKFKIHQLLKFGGVMYIGISVAYLVLIKYFDYNLIQENLFFILFISVNFIAGLTSAVINAPLNASISKYVDPNKIGKVVTLMDSFGGILMPFAILIAGLVIDYLSIYYVLYAMMFGIVLITVVIMRNQHIRLLQ